jgi:galactose mutarotase-like enzyme
MIKEVEVAKENVVMRAGRCALTLLPHLGGKIASIRIGDQEMLQAPLAAYAGRTRSMRFDAGDASGWDECLPSVAACVVQTEAGEASIPDHGDLWRVQWRESPAIESEEMTSRGQDLSSGARIALCGACFSLPLALERTIQLTESPVGYKLGLDYRLKNTGASPAPWSWAAHPLFAAEAGDRIVLPGSISQLRLEGSGGNRLGNKGDMVSWPVAALGDRSQTDRNQTDGNRTDLSLAEAADSNIGDKLFAGPLRAAENWCALERPRAGVRIRVSFDPGAIPYLGMWICYGGWPDGPGPKQACVALEPTTAPVDSLAETGPWSRVLAAGASFSWRMEVEFQSMECVDRYA